MFRLAFNSYATASRYKLSSNPKILKTISKQFTASFSSTSTQFSDTGEQPGAVWVWGKGPSKDSAFGLIPGISDASSPIYLSTFEGIAKKVCLGPSKLLILTENGELYACGKDDHFALGLGDGAQSTHATEPTRVGALDGIKIVDCSVGEHHAAAVSEDGEVFTWGYGGGLLSTGALGHGDKASQPRPALVETLADAGVKIVQVDCGSAHTVALSDEGRVYTWGKGDYGRLGNGISSQEIPEIVELLENHRIVQVSAGKDFTLALTDRGTIYGFGKNDQSQLGLGANMVMDLNTMEQFPMRLNKLAGQVTMIAAGGHHCLALTSDSRVFVWGGRTFIEPTERDEFASLPDGDKAAFVAAGDGTSSVITTSGSVYTWGRNFMGHALGHASRGSQRQPRKVEGLSEQVVSQISLGSKTGAAVVGLAPAAPKPIENPDSAVETEEEEEPGFFASLFK